MRPAYDSVSTATVGAARCSDRLRRSDDELESHELRRTQAVILLDQLADARILAILRMDDLATAGVDRALRLNGAGVRAIECTLDSPGALEVISVLRDRLGPDTVVGAGTVTRRAEVEGLVETGVDFCVTPHIDPELIEAALGSGLAMIPGVMTPSEIAAAFQLGVPAVKLFPAGPLGIDYLRALQGPFGDFPVIPTGGITVADAPAWLDAGAMCVGLGSALTSPTADPGELSKALRR